MYITTVINVIQFVNFLYKTVLTTSTASSQPVSVVYLTRNGPGSNPYNSVTCVLHHVRSEVSVMSVGQTDKSVGHTIKTRGHVGGKYLATLAVVSRRYAQI